MIDIIFIGLIFNLVINLPIAIIFQKYNTSFSRILMFGLLSLIIGFVYDIWWKERSIICNKFSTWVMSEK